MSTKTHLRNQEPKDQIFNCVNSDISHALKETPFTIADSIKTGSPVKTKIVRVVSLCTMENNRDNMI